MYYKKCHIKPTPEKWKQMLEQDDLRFFNGSRKMKNATSLFPYGVLVKLDSWNKPTFRESYTMSKLCKNANAIEYLCYFEYEEDIIRFLTGSPEIYEDNAVIMMPAYCEIYEITTDVLKQTILYLYHLLFSKKISINNISYDNIYIDKLSKHQNLQYDICENKYCIKTNEVVKIDVGECGIIQIEKMKSIGPKHYRRLLENIYNIMPTDGLKEFVKSFFDHNDDSKLIDPLKILDCLLSTVVATQCHFPNKCYRSQYSQSMNHFQSNV
jgi:hypothetical protein